MKKKEKKEQLEEKEGCTCKKDCHCGEPCDCEEKNNGEEKCCDESCQCSSNEEEISKLKTQNKILEEKLVRNQAELLNYKRRREEEIGRMLKYSEEGILSDFLPILDNFERAIKMDDSNLEDEVSKFLSGFKMIYASTNQLLEKYEVKEIDCLDKEFDPNTSQAVLTDKDENKPSGIVLEVLQKGYIYKDKVIRPAMVKVNE